MSNGDPPLWVIDHIASPYTAYLPLGSGYVLMRDGVVVDRWPAEQPRPFWERPPK